MNKQSLFIIENSIEKGGEISPFLFLGQNLEILHADIQVYISGLLQKYNIDQQSVFTLENTDEALKISQVKNFIAKSQVKARFAFQVFIIEDISRMTHQAQNACLKFFEEPGEGNIVILTSSSTSGILDTILSRLQIHSVGNQTAMQVSEFYKSMIFSYKEQDSDELIRYMFSTKLEKAEYVEFLKALIDFVSTQPSYNYLLDDIHEDIGGILKNNLQGKYICDKYIMLLKK